MNQESLLRFVERLFQGLVWLAFFGVLVWGVSALFHHGVNGTSYIALALRYLGMIVLTVVGFLIASLGGYGLLQLMRMLTGRATKAIAERSLDSPLIACIVLNFLLLVATGYLLDWIGLAGWMEAIDDYSRTNGFKDGLTVGIFLILMLWPFPIMFALARLSPKRYGSGLQRNTRAKEASPGDAQL